MAVKSNDRNIASKIHETLQLDSRLQQKDISIQVEKGVVTLSGTVGSYLDKMVAAEDAWRVEGVKEVRNRLKVQPDTVRPAEDIAEEIAAALEMDPRVDAHSVVVNVSEGIVRLSGTVSSADERAAAEECAWQAEGVVDVSNELTISPDRRRADAEIEQDVRTALDTDARIADPTLITVRSVAGTVRLQGEVSSAEERQAAEKDAWYTAGVVYVENLLSITGEREQPAAA
ncbi:MAG: BON domain-containing protein [Chloroflexota bacterium]|jgi:osmotically-inducible protein OsmY